MKKSDAVKHLRNLMYGVQKVRSIARESKIIMADEDPELLSISESFAEKLWPWVWGEKSILNSLSKILDNVDATGELSPHDFYNIVFIATHLEPMLGTLASLSGIMNEEKITFPEEVNINWLKGWEQE